MKVLFLSYNGLLEPILPSQALPYLKGLTGSDYEFILLTYEKKKDLDRVGAAAIKELKEGLKQDGIEWYHLRYHKSPPVLSTIFDLIVGSLKTFFLIKSAHVKIVHVRGVTPGVIMIMLSKLLRVKILFDMRGLLAEEYVGGGMWKTDSLQFRLVKRAEKKLLTIADAVTVLTQKHFDLNRSLDYLEKRNIPMEVIPCCVDTTKFDYEESSGIGLRDSIGLKNKFVLMYPGKLGSFYYIDEMIAFFGSMIKMIPEAVLFVVTNDDPKIVIDRTEALNIPKDKVFIKTNVAFDKMPSYMRLADTGIFFINPYNKFGSSPIKMGEFLASGVPVIINPGVGDTEELVRVNRVGVVVNKFDEKDFKLAVDELLNLKKEGENLRARCRDTAKKHLSKDEAIIKYAEIYKVLSSAESQ